MMGKDRGRVKKNGRIEKKKGKSDKRRNKEVKDGVIE